MGARRRRPTTRIPRSRTASAPRGHDRATSGSRQCPGSTATRPCPEEPGAERFLGYRVNRVARATMLEHRSGDRPWLVCLHGFGMGRPGLDLRAFRALHLHRDLGLNLAFLTLPFHGRRNPGPVTSPPMPSADALDTVHGLTQAVWDTRQLLAHLRTRTAQPIGLMGLSLGGLVAATVASVDAPHAVLLLVPAVDLPALAADAIRGEAELGSTPEIGAAAPGRAALRAGVAVAADAEGSDRTAVHPRRHARPLRPPDLPGRRPLAPLGPTGPALVPRRARLAVLGPRCASRDRGAASRRRTRVAVDPFDVVRARDVVLAVLR